MSDNPPNTWLNGNGHKSLVIGRPAENLTPPKQSKLPTATHTSPMRRKT